VIIYTLVRFLLIDARSRLSVNSLREVVRKAGLSPSRVFETSDYLTDRFEELIKYSQIGDLMDLKLREPVKSEFEVRMKSVTNSSGKTQQNVRFYVATVSQGG